MATVYSTEVCGFDVGDFCSHGLFMTKNEHCRMVTTGSNIEDPQLAGWVKLQQAFRENSMLLPERKPNGTKSALIGKK
jgi:hypothetical protein